MIILNTNGKTPLYQQLYEQIKQKIISGDYPKGARLTPTRTLAMDLCIGRNTVESAYDQLCAEGYVESRQGSGFTVMDLTKELLEFPNMIDGWVMGSNDPPHSDKQDASSVEQDEPDYHYIFKYGEVDYRTFPHAQWRKVTAKTLAQTDPENLYTYGNKQGERPLRKEIDRENVSRAPH